MKSKQYTYLVKSIGLSRRGGRKPQSLTAAARHNLREIQAEHGATNGKIDSSRTYLNQILIGPKTAQEVVEKALDLFKKIGLDPSTLRKDYTQAIEHVFSLPNGQKENGFFELIAETSKKIFGENNVLSFVVHRDQSQPHAHMLISPISGQKYQGSKIVAKIALKQLKEKFRHATETIGFEPTSNAKVRREKTSIEAATVIAHLQHLNHPMLFDPVWPSILEMINSNPGPLLEHLGFLDTQQPQHAPLLRLPASNTNEVKAIGLQRDASNHANLSCVGIEKPLVSRTHPEEADQKHSEIVRLRDIQLSTQYFNPDTGEFQTPKESMPSNKVTVQDWVDEELLKRKLLPPRKLK